MQWLIDIITERILDSLSGIIVAWAGTISNIPNGWNLCDGTGGTADLRDKFIRGAPAGTEPGSTGGTLTHNHSYSGYTAGDDIGFSASGGIDEEVSVVGHEHEYFGNTNQAGTLPPYYTVLYIQKT